MGFPFLVSIKRHDEIVMILRRQQWRNIITIYTIFDFIIEICTIDLVCEPIFYADVVKFEKVVCCCLKKFYL